MNRATDEGRSARENFESADGGEQSRHHCKNEIGCAPAARAGAPVNRSASADRKGAVTSGSILRHGTTSKYLAGGHDQMFHDRTKRQGRQEGEATDDHDRADEQTDEERAVRGEGAG